MQGKGWAPVTGLCSAHYFDERDGLVAIGWYEEGTRFLDVRDPAGIRQVGYWVPTKGETWSTYFPPTDRSGEIVYALDFARGIDVLRFDRGDRRVRRAPVRRSWLRARPGSPGTGAGRTGLTRATDFGFICRLPSRRDCVRAAPSVARDRVADAARLGQPDVRQLRARQRQPADVQHPDHGSPREPKRPRVTPAPWRRITGDSRMSRCDGDPSHARTVFHTRKRFPECHSSASPSSAKRLLAQIELWCPNTSFSISQREYRSADPVSDADRSNVGSPCCARTELIAAVIFRSALWFAVSADAGAGMTIRTQTAVMATACTSLAQRPPLLLPTGLADGLA